MKLNTFRNVPNNRSKCKPSREEAPTGIQGLLSSSRLSLSPLPLPTSEHLTGLFQSNETAGKKDETHRTTVRLARLEIESVAVVVVAKMVRRIRVLGAKQRVW